MDAISAVFRRELRSYFQTPVAYVFLVVFLLASGGFTFQLSGFFERGLADLTPFFRWHPWLYLFLVPAVTMRLWAEEQHSGTIELLVTKPAPLWQLILGKFFAAWLFVFIALTGTAPVWLTVNYLGDPDNGVIIASYLGSLLMAGAYLAIGMSMSAVTHNQIIAFILSATVSLIFLMAGYPLVTVFLEELLPAGLVEHVSALSILTQFNTISHGILTIDSVVYFLSMGLFWLFVTLLILQYKRGRL
jgi:ABC-2 type transport system permease protein